MGTAFDMILRATKNYKKDYSDICFLDIYSVESLIHDIAMYWMVFTDDSGLPSASSYDKDAAFEYFDTFRKEIRRILDNNIAGGSLKVIYPESDDTSVLGILKKKKKKPYIKLAEFAVWAIENNLNCPQEFRDKAPANAKSGNKTVTAIEKPLISIEPQEVNEAEYEDIISDEAILKLMELPLPKMKQQVAMLAAEKKKTDAAIMAAAKIGFMFYEEGLSKPTTEKLFVSEYKKYLDKLPELPDTTIKRIYKNLPEGYRASRDGGKVTSDQADVVPIIKAAAFAGSMAYERDSMNVSALKKSLSLEQYLIPSDDILKEIIAAVKKLELDVDE